MNKKVLLIIPHTAQVRGAEAIIPEEYRHLWQNRENISEFCLGNIILPKVAEYLGHSGLFALVLDRNKGFREIQRGAARYFGIDAGSPDFVDLSLELHFNSFERPSANGLEILVQEEDHETQIKSALLASHVAQAYDLKLRHTTGVKVIGSTERGDWNLSSIEKISKHEILTEFFFGSSPDDCEKIFSKGPQFYAETIAKSVLWSFFDINLQPIEENVDYKKKYDDLKQKYDHIVYSLNEIVNNY